MLLLGWWVALGCGVFPLPAAAQQDRPRRGKIDEVERAADDEEDVGGIFSFLDGVVRFLIHVVPWVESQGAGQGYLAYPYAERRAVERFLLRGVRRDRTFNRVAGSYFRDEGSSLRGAHFAYEGAVDILGFGAEYDYFREPKTTETDYLHLGRLGFFGLAPLAQAGYLKVGLALRGLVLDDGRSAFGPEFELGAQLFPARPVALDGSVRLAGLTGAAASWFGTALADVNLGGGILVGRIELRGDYRWIVIGDAATLAGPRLGARVWF